MSRLIQVLGVRDIYACAKIFSVKFVKIANPQNILCLKNLPLCGNYVVYVACHYAGSGRQGVAGGGRQHDRGPQAPGQEEHSVQQPLRRDEEEIECRHSSDRRL